MDKLHPHSCYDGLNHFNYYFFLFLIKNLHGFHRMSSFRSTKKNIILSNTHEPVLVKMTNLFSIDLVISVQKNYKFFHKYLHLFCRKCEKKSLALFMFTNFINSNPLSISTKIKNKSEQKWFISIWKFRFYSIFSNHN